MRVGSVRTVCKGGEGAAAGERRVVSFFEVGSLISMWYEADLGLI